MANDLEGNPLGWVTCKHLVFAFSGSGSGFSMSMYRFHNIFFYIYLELFSAHLLRCGDYGFRKQGLVNLCETSPLR